MNGFHDARRTRGLTTLALLVALLALGLPAQAGKHKGHHGHGEPGRWIEKHADELGLDDATRTEIEGIVAASRDSAEAIYEEHRAARDAMHALLEQDEPDRAAVMAQAERIGEIEVRKHQQRLATMLDIRAKLSPDQRAKLSELKSEMRERRHDRDCGKRHGRRHGGERGHGGEGDEPGESL